MTEKNNKIEKIEQRKKKNKLPKKLEKMNRRIMAALSLDDLISNEGHSEGVRREVFVCPLGVWKRWGARPLTKTVYETIRLPSNSWPSLMILDRRK